jgi:hypothetical protein
MISSNSSVDFFSVLRASGQHPAEFIKTDEFKEWIRSYLVENELTIIFTKKDGTDRTMRCTRNLELIPTENHPKTTETPESQTQGDSMRAFDLDINEWRSFNISTLKHINW